jgi:hypothetical protein
LVHQTSLTINQPIGTLLSYLKDTKNKENVN